MIVAALVRIRRRVAIWMAVAAAAAIAIGWLPLFGVLGYELALAMTAIAAPCGLDLGAALARAVQLSPSTGIERARFAGRTVAATTVTAAALAGAVMLVPAIVCAIRGAWVETCDWAFGIEAYALMPLTTAILGGALGHAIAAAVGTRAQKRWWPHRGTVLALAVPLIAVAAAALWRFYSEPPAFTYNAVLGYFPGNLYDENVQIGAPLLWSRLEELAWVVAIAAAVAARLDVPAFRIRRSARPAGRRVGAWLVALVAVAGGAALHHEGGALGYAIDAGDIQAVLEGRVETEHFVIHYMHTPSIDRDIELIAEDHEFRYAEVVAQLGVTIDGKITSYYFGSGEQKARWMGARDVEMAKPWRHEIYVDDRAYPQGALRHEIAHVVASKFGDPIFGVAMKHGVFASPGLIEGLAVAIDWPADGALTPHQQVHALAALGFAPSVAELFSLDFFTTSSSRGYTTAGSFVRYLLDTYGAEKLRALYRSGGDFAGVYGEPLTQLESGWRSMIAAIELPADVIEGLRERFRGGSVFARPCPHAIAKRREAAAYASARGDHAGAIALMRTVCSEAPDEPAYRLRLGDYLSEGDASERTDASALWNAVADDTRVTSSLRAEALRRLANVAGARGDLKTTAALVDRGVALPLDPEARRMFAAQQLVLAHEGPAGPALRAYFFAPALVIDAHGWAAIAVAREPELGIAHYLLGLQEFSADHWQPAAAELARAIELGLPSIGFVENAAKKLAVAAYRTGDAALVTRAIAALTGAGTSEVDHLLGQDWSRRLTFHATAHL